MYKQYFLWSIENIWKTASFLIIILAVPITIILAISGFSIGKAFLVLLLGATFPVIPATMGEDLARILSNIKDIGIFLFPFAIMFALSTSLEGIYLLLSWIIFIAICAFAFYVTRYVYINFDELVSRQILYRNSNVGMLDTKWKYVFNRYSYIVTAVMYVITLITIYILISISNQ